MTISTDTQEAIRKAWELRSDRRDREAEDLLIAFARAAKGGAEDQAALADTFTMFADEAHMEGNDSGYRIAQFMNGEAFDCYQRAANMAPNDPKIALATARAANRYRFIGAAFDHTRRAITLDSANPEAWLFLAQLLYSRREWQVADRCRLNAACLRAGLPDKLDMDAMTPTVRPKGPRPTRR